MSNLYGFDLRLPDVHDGELVTDVRTVDPGRDGIYLGGSPHTGGIVQIGMLTAALDCAHDYEEDDE